MVRGVVVLDQEPRDELAPFAASGERFPLSDLLATMQCAEAIELRIERLGVAEEMSVLNQQEIDARFESGFQKNARRSAHAAHQRLGNLKLADFLRFAFDEHRPRGVEDGNLV